MLNSVSYKEIARIALPIMVSGLSVHLIGLIDTIFLAQLGEVELGAAGNSTLLYYTWVISLSGLALGAQIIIGRRNGEQKFEAISSVFSMSMIIMLLLSLGAFFALFFGSEPLAKSIYASHEIATTTAKFMTFRSFGIFPSMINYVFIAFYVGITRTRVLAIVSPLLAVVNISFDYLLIFGKGPFPALGVEGAAIASVIAEAFGTIFFIAYTVLNRDLSRYRLSFKINYDKEILHRIWVIGSPLVLQYFVAMASWFIFFSVIERINERALAVSHIVRALYMVLGIPLTAWSDAANTLVSNLIGEKRTQQIVPTLKKIAVLLLIIDVLYCVGLNLFPTEVLGLFTKDISLIYDAIPTIRVISFSLTFFSLAFLSFRALAGAGLTKLCMRIEVFTVVIYLSCAFALVTWFDAPTALVWCTEFVYFGLLGGISLVYLLRGKYNTQDF